MKFLARYFLKSKNVIILVFITTVAIIYICSQNGNAGVYLAFGKALKFMEMPPHSGNIILMDVHSAGAQRSKPKTGETQTIIP